MKRKIIDPAIGRGCVFGSSLLAHIARSLSEENPHTRPLSFHLPQPLLPSLLLRRRRRPPNPPHDCNRASLPAPATRLCLLVFSISALDPSPSPSPPLFGVAEMTNRRSAMARTTDSFASAAAAAIRSSHAGSSVVGHRRRQDMPLPNLLLVEARCAMAEEGEEGDAMGARLRLSHPLLLSITRGEPMEAVEKGPPAQEERHR
ncbi:hypothetical protein ACQJBY_068633 [Aegilops geniculata]